MAGDKKQDIQAQQDLLLRMKDILKGMHKDGITDENTTFVLQAFQGAIRTYQEYLDAEKSALSTADDKKEVNRLKMEILNLRQQKLTEMQRNQELSGKLISYKHMDKFREFVGEFWKGIEQNPKLASQVFGIEIALEDDPSKSTVLTKKVDFIIASFLDISKANASFNDNVTRYALAAGDAETKLEREQTRANTLEAQLSKVNKAKDELQAGFDDVTLKWQDANNALEALEQEHEKAVAQFENIKNDLQADLDSEKSARQAYELVYTAVLEILPEEDRKDLPELLRDTDEEIPNLVKTLITSALVKKIELDEAQERYERAEKAIEAIFGEEKFKEYQNLGSVPNEHYIWAVQTFQEAAVKPLDEARADIEQRKIALLEIQTGISDLMLLFKDDSSKQVVGKILAAELDREREQEQDADKEPAEYILAKLPYIKQKVEELRHAQASGQEQVTALSEQIAGLEAEVEASQAQYEPEPLDAQTLIYQASASKIAGKIYADEDSLLAAKAQYRMAADLCEQALEAAKDEEQKNNIQKELSLCAKALEKLEED